MMRNAIKEYIEYSHKEKNDLWNTATFVFDTNVFLNLYRYSNKTRDQLIESFEWLKSRIWMPYQVALEFCKERYSVINEANRRFDNKGKSIDKATIDEVELFTSVMKKKVSRAELKEYYESLEDQEERQAAKLRFNIANLERKNQKRRNSIVALSKKASEGQLSAEEEVALQRNKINLAEGEEKLVRLNERLSYML